MGLLANLRDKGLSLRSEGANLLVEPREAITESVRTAIRANKPALLSELATEAAERLEEASADVLARLKAHPTVKRTFFTRFEGDVLIVTLALRGVGTCELSIVKDRFNRDSLADYAMLARCIEHPT